VSNITTFRQGIVLFDHSGTRTTRPACAANFPQRWTIDVTTPGGQANLSVIMTAYAQHRSIRIVGLGACSDWGDTEAANYVVTVD